MAPNATAGETVSFTLHLADASGNDLAASAIASVSPGAGVTLSPIDGQVATDSSGQAVFTVAATLVGSYTVQVDCGGFTLTQTLTIGPAAPDALESSISTDTASLVGADGVAIGQVTVTARDRYGNPAPGAPVVVDANGSSAQFPAGGSQSTAADGTASFQATDAVTEDVQVRATVGSGLGAFTLVAQVPLHFFACLIHPAAGAVVTGIEADALPVAGLCAPGAGAVQVSAGGRSASAACSGGRWLAALNVRGLPNGALTLQVDQTASGGAAVVSCQRTLTQVVGAQVTAPSLERFELVASDGLEPPAMPDGGPFGYASNAWGGHMPRIADSSDGTVNLLYLRLDATNTPSWRLLRRAPDAGAPSDAGSPWAQVVEGDTSDEAHLLRDPVTDTVRVLAYPAGLPALWEPPYAASTPVPGAWFSMPDTSRHYGNAGTGPDGSVCLKQSHENGSTANTDTLYACAHPDGGALTWGPVITHTIGERHAYDYLFPQGDVLVAASQSDLYKTVAGYPNLAGFPYVFDGVRRWATGEDGDAVWDQSELHPALPVADAGYASYAPLVNQLDALVDHQGRIFSVALERSTDGYTPLVTLGFFLSVADARTGAPIYSGQLNSVPTYGYLRLVEDGANRLWLLWTNLGTQLSQLKVYRVVETNSGSGTTFSLGAATDLSGAFAPFPPGWAYTPVAFFGAPYVAVPRTGASPANLIEGYVNACTETFSPEAVASRPSFDTSVCFGPGNFNPMQVYYFRIRLPDP